MFDFYSRGFPFVFVMRITKPSKYPPFKFPVREPFVQPASDAERQIHPVATSNIPLTSEFVAMPDQISVFHNLWKELHQRALNHTSGSDSVWLSGWKNRIPKIGTGCPCKEHMAVWSSQNRLDFSSSETYFAWTVAAHNSVNAKLGKKIFTVEEARKNLNVN